MFNQRFSIPCSTVEKHISPADNLPFHPQQQPGWSDISPRSSFQTPRSTRAISTAAYNEVNRKRKGSYTYRLCSPCRLLTAFQGLHPEPFPFCIFRITARPWLNKEPVTIAPISINLSLQKPQYSLPILTSNIKAEVYVRPCSLPVFVLPKPYTSDISTPCNDAPKNVVLVRSFLPV